MMFRALLVGLFVSVPTLCLADTWSDALHAELEKGDLKKALKLYKKVEKSDKTKVFAERAGWRRVVVRARQGKRKPLERAIKRFKRTYPGSNYLRRVKRAERDLTAFMAQHRPRGSKLRAKLKKQRVTLNFADTPLSDVTDFMRDITGVSFLLLPGTDRDGAVTLRLQNQSLEDALLEIVKQRKVSWDVFAGSVVIGKNAAALQPQRFTRKQVAANPKAYLKLKTAQISLSFRSTPLEEVFAFMKDLFGLTCVLGNGVDKKHKVTLKLKGVRLESALRLVAAQAGLRYGLTKTGLTVEKKQTKKQGR